MNNPQQLPSAEPARVAIDPQVVFSRREIGRQTAFLAHHPAIGKFFQLGAEEYRVASLLNGNRTLTEVLQVLEADGIRWDATEAADFISKLVASQIARQVSAGKEDPSTAPAHATPPCEVSSAGPRPSRPSSWSQRLPRMLSLLVSQRIPLFNGQIVATRLEKRIGILFSAIGILYWMALVGTGLMIVLAHRQDFARELRRMFDPGIWLVLLVMWVVAKAIHEIGHAVAARYHRVHVGKIGILFFFLAPLAYVDVTDAWKLKSRWTRVQIALAGVYLELAVASLAAWAWWFLPQGMASHLCAQFFLVAGPATLLVNANPLLRLDGYYVLSDLTEIPNLRMHGRQQLSAHLERWLLKMDHPRPLLSGWRRTLATIHAACSVLFQIVWMGGLIIGVSMWAKGLGVVLAFAALTLWVILPLSRWAGKVWMLEPPGRWYLNPTRMRLLYWAGVLVLAIQYLCATNSPFARRVPVVVQFRDQQIARAAADAFVKTVYVTRGQRVSRGLLLVELEDPELLIQRDSKTDDLEIAELRAVQYRRQGELSKSAAESENAASLRRQIMELNEQLVGLKVIAQRDGFVLGPAIESLQGRFVTRGAELLRVSDPQEKELLAAVSEADMQAYQAAASEALPAQVRLRGGSKFTTVPASLRPRARRSLPHPAFAATVGGPLPVEPSSNENDPLQLAQPQLQSVTPLDPVTSAEIHAGQVGTMTIGDNRSLVARLIDTATHQ